MIQQIVRETKSEELRADPSLRGTIITPIKIGRKIRNKEGRSEARSREREGAQKLV